MEYELQTARNKIFKLMKKIVMAAVLLYTYNQFAVSFNAIIPINFVTIAFVSILGIPAMVGLILFNFIFF